MRWSLRPLRALGSKASPVAILSWNGSPVLATSISYRQSEFRQPIAAGPRFPSLADTSKGCKETPWQNGEDPWTAWIRTHPGQTPAASQAMVRQVQGPVEQRLATQDEKIQGLEERMQTMIDMQAKQQNTIQQVQTEQQGAEQRLSTQLTSAIEGVKQELSASFAGALSQQSTSFNSNLQDIKQLILQSKRKSATRNEEDMSS